MATCHRWWASPTIARDQAVSVRENQREPPGTHHGTPARNSVPSQCRAISNRWPNTRLMGFLRVLSHRGPSRGTSEGADPVLHPPRIGLERPVRRRIALRVFRGTRARCQPRRRSSRMRSTTANLRREAASWLSLGRHAARVGCSREAGACPFASRPVAGPPAPIRPVTIGCQQNRAQGRESQGPRRRGRQAHRRRGCRTSKLKRPTALLGGREQLRMASHESCVRIERLQRADVLARSGACQGDPSPNRQSAASHL